jgi:hypothetical protein
VTAVPIRSIDRSVDRSIDRPSSCRARAVRRSDRDPPCSLECTTTACACLSVSTCVQTLDAQSLAAGGATLLSYVPAFVADRKRTMGGGPKIPIDRAPIETVCGVRSSYVVRLETVVGTWNPTATTVASAATRGDQNANAGQDLGALVGRRRQGVECSLGDVGTSEGRLHCREFTSRAEQSHSARDSRVCARSFVPFLRTRTVGGSHRERTTLTVAHTKSTNRTAILQQHDSSNK